MRFRSLVHIIAALIALVTVCGGLLGSPAPAAAQGEACFAETNQCLRGRFLDYWTTNGGLARNGFPLTPERQELLEDGNEYTVQYFERVRLEYHPEHAPPYDVLLGQFGRRVARTNVRPEGLPDTTPTAPIAGRVYFAETGHNLGGGFLAHWQANGGLAQFGYPITEEFEQSLAEALDGTVRYRVQYFERARFEYHPENAPPYDVLLGQFGRRILRENELLAGDRGFNLLYLASERVQGQLGFPTGSGERAPGAYQAFERGALLYQGGGARRIYVFCGDERAGRSFASRLFAPYFPDTWREGDDPGGGPGPTPGLYQPKLGFGKLWRERPDIRDCLGYATTPDETAYTIRVQQFVRGNMLSATTSAGRFIYVQYQGDGYRYERYPDPSP
jgi:hypothetical protein